MFLLLALALDRAQLSLAGQFYGNPFSGLGAVDNTNNRVAYAPMAYRVFVPWLLYLIGRIVPLAHNRMLAVYEAIKVALLAFALGSIQIAAGAGPMLITGCLLPMTYGFDYWDWCVELGALALAYSGSLQLALIGGILLTMSRETAPLVPLTYLLATGDIAGAFVIGTATALTMLGVRLWAGYKPLYCDRFMWRRNIGEVKRMFTCSPWFMSNIGISLLITALTLGLTVVGKLGPTWPIPLILLALGWTMGVAFETRIFASCLFWIAVGLWR